MEGGVVQETGPGARMVDSGGSDPVGYSYRKGSSGWGLFCRDGIEAGRDLPPGHHAVPPGWNCTKDDPVPSMNGLVSEPLVCVCGGG